MNRRPMTDDGLSRIVSDALRESRAAEGLGPGDPDAARVVLERWISAPAETRARLCDAVLERAMANGAQVNDRRP